MSKTENRSKTRKTSTARRTKVGPAMSGSEILVKALEREGVDVTVIVGRDFGAQ